MTLSHRLAELGIDLPPVASPVAAYVPAITGLGTVRTSGQLPFSNGELLSTGACGTGPVPIEQAALAARQCALNAVAAAAAAAGGLDRLRSAVKVTGFVASTPDFFDQPKVLNGASELLQELFGTQHIRSAVGVAALPLNATVEVEVEFSLA